MHDARVRCPGELLATGTERHGWRVQVEETLGVRVYAALIAPCGSKWRARIITYPNIIWIIPRGGSMKFIGATPAEAEQQAIDYIKAHCKARGYTTKKELPAVDSGEFDPEQDTETAASEEIQASRRALRTLPVRYGLSRPTDEAETDDLSEGGLFIRTDNPYPVGADLQLQLELEGFGVPLRGIVQWTRDKPESGRPVGMGIKLLQPHPRYIHFVRQRRTD